MSEERTITTVINTQLCDGCGKCIAVCPTQSLVLKDGKAFVAGEHSLACDHCASICPNQAIWVAAIEPEVSRYQTFKTENSWLPHGEYHTGRLVQLMRSRRSCRNYTNRPVDRRLIEDLIKVGVTAPSGTNSQKWTFTVLPDRRHVVELGNRIARFFKKTNRMAQRGWLRWILKMAGKNRLDRYFHEHFDTVEKALKEWETDGIDRLFHGATAIVIVGSKPDASCPREDVLLATQNILLAAHSMGLGTCLIGFAVEAIRNDISIQRFIRIPEDETVYAVIALGHPKERYVRTAGRKPFVVRYTDCV